jgi:hypothetical protein
MYLPCTQPWRVGPQHKTKERGLRLLSGVAGQALSGTLLLMVPCDDLPISCARVLKAMQYTCSSNYSISNTRSQPCDKWFLMIEQSLQRLAHTTRLLGKLCMSRSQYSKVDVTELVALVAMHNPTNRDLFLVVKHAQACA